jgi:hypothetical protein
MMLIPEDQSVIRGAARMGNLFSCKVFFLCFLYKSGISTKILNPRYKSEAVRMGGNPEGTKMSKV